MPKLETPHHDFADVRIHHGGKRWSAAYRVENGRLMVSSAWGSLSERLRDGMEPRLRAAELLHAIIATRSLQNSAGS